MKEDRNPTMDNPANILIYQNPQGEIKLDVRLEDETVWLNQAQIAQLFGKARSTISEHIAHVFKEGELNEQLVCRDFRQTSQHGAVEGKTPQKSNTETTRINKPVNLQIEKIRKHKAALFNSAFTIRIMNQNVEGVQ